LLSVYSITPPLARLIANSLHELGEIRINKDDVFTALRDVFAKMYWRLCMHFDGYRLWNSSLCDNLTHLGRLVNAYTESEALALA
jgi:hypothetical protein